MMTWCLGSIRKMIIFSGGTCHENGLWCHKHRSALEPPCESSESWQRWEKEETEAGLILLLLSTTRWWWRCFGFAFGMHSCCPSLYAVSGPVRVKFQATFMNVIQCNPRPHTHTHMHTMHAHTHAYAHTHSRIRTHINACTCNTVHFYACFLCRR